MATVDEGSTDMGEEEVEIIMEKVSNNENKTLVFIRKNESCKQFLYKRRKRTPKNLHLIEGDPVELIQAPRKKREIRTFPNQQLLISKIKEANGTDYSNQFIEEHFNRHSKIIGRCKKSTKSSGIFEIMRRKKICLENRNSKLQDFENENNNQIPVNVMEDSSKNELEIIDDDKIENFHYSRDCNEISNPKSKSKSKSLVPYSSSESENESEEVEKLVEEVDERIPKVSKLLKIPISRSFLFLEGLDDGKFMFRSEENVTST